MRPTKKNARRTPDRRTINGYILDVSAAAQFLGSTDKSLRAMVARRVIPFRRLNTKIIFVKEELILFPFVKRMVKAKLENQAIQSPQFGTVENPIAMMMQEHDTEGERFREIAELTDNYTPPADACNTYKVTFAMLDAFEKDLHLHIHLENNILFPEAIKLEQQFD